MPQVKICPLIAPVARCSPFASTVCVCVLHERSQICTGKGADDAPTDGRTEFVAGHVMYKAEAAASLPPSSLRLLGWSRHCKNSPSRLRLSLSLSSGSRCRGRLLTTSRRRRKCRPGSQVFVRFPTFDRFHNFYFLHSVTIFVADLLLTTAKQILVCNTISTKAR